MSSYVEGTVEMTCRVLLEHPRWAAHSHIAVIFDAILNGSRIANGDVLLCCSFRYVKKEAGEYYEPGIYDVAVRVSDSVTLFVADNELTQKRLHVSNLKRTNLVPPVSRQIFLLWET